jgi:pimeloyl-ACP methyl ester carboxylesterase
MSAAESTTAAFLGFGEDARVVVAHTMMYPDQVGSVILLNASAGPTSDDPLPGRAVRRERERGKGEGFELAAPSAAHELSSIAARNKRTTSRRGRSGSELESHGRRRFVVSLRDREATNRTDR